jgi:L-lactate dehydrogenase complex protein LldG
MKNAVAVEHRVKPGLVDLFVERAREDAAHVHVCGPDLVEETLAAVLAGRPTVVGRRFPWSLPKPVSHRRLDRGRGTPIEAAATTATLGVATTGAVVLTPGDGRRALTLSPELHVCVLRSDQLVTGVPEAIATLNPHSKQSWVTGPAADHEIELDRVGAVLTTRSLHVVLVDSGDRAA